MTPEEPEAVVLIREIAVLLEELGIPYHLGGSHASSVHGIPRQTQDIDLVVDPTEEAVRRLVDRIRSAYYVDLAAAQAARERRASFNLIHLASGIKIDLFVVGAGAFDRSEFERARSRTIDFGGQRIFVKSAEDTILRKLLWYREGGEVSERQWSDASGILRAQAGALDREYLDRWAGVVGVEDLWRRLQQATQD